MSSTVFEPDYAVSPGETLRETIQHLELSQKDLAQRMDRPLKTINEMIQGIAAITADTAIQLEKITGVPADFWNNAEANYRKRLARIHERKRAEAPIDDSLRQPVGLRPAPACGRQGLNNKP